MGGEEGTAEAGVLKGGKTGEKCYLGRAQRENVRELGKWSVPEMGGQGRGGGTFRLLSPSRVLY